MDRRERFIDQEEPFRIAADALRASLWTAMPGIIESFDLVTQTATVQPAIQQTLLRENTTRALPVLADVPIYFPSGGGLTLTFPVQPGDECLLIFASRCIDAWWQSGGVQPAGEARTHSLSDAFAFVGARSRPRALGAFNDAAAQLRTDSGSGYIELKPGGKVRIVAPEGVEITGNVTVLNSNVAVQSGNVSVSSGNVTADGIGLKTHRHGSVQPGAGVSGVPQ
jgi:hypothetical protein